MILKKIVVLILTYVVTVIAHRYTQVESEFNKLKMKNKWCFFL